MVSIPGDGGKCALFSGIFGMAASFEFLKKDYVRKNSKEAREKAETEQENAIRKRKEERKEQEKRIAESRNEDTDTVSISESGKATLDEKTFSAQTGADNGISVEETEDAVKKEPVIYTKTGEAASPEPRATLSVSV